MRILLQKYRNTVSKFTSPIPHVQVIEYGGIRCVYSSGEGYFGVGKRPVHLLTIFMI